MPSDISSPASVTDRLENVGERVLKREYTGRVRRNFSSSHRDDLNSQLSRGLNRLGASVRRQPLRWILIGLAIGGVVALTAYECRD